jgi:hypothetical protein
MLTLSDVKKGKADKVDQAIIDQFRRSSILFDLMPFDDCVAPGGTGSTLTYGYMRKTTASPAALRDIGSDYIAGEAKRTQYTTNLKIMGGKFGLDRALNIANPQEVAFQAEEQVIAAKNLFLYNVVNGNADTAFDGLSKALTGTDTEITSAADLSTVSATTALVIIEELNTAIMACKRKPSVILANSKAIIKLKTAAAALGYLTRSEDSFGRQVEGFDGIPFVDAGRYYNDALGRDVDIIETGGDGKTDIYLICLAQDAFHGVSPSGGKVINSKLPDFTNSSDAVVYGFVEMIASVALKDTRGAAVIRDVKVQTPTVATTLTVAITGNGAGAVVTVNPALPKIGNTYYTAVSSSAIAAPSAGTALDANVYTALPANGVVNVTANYYCRVVEADANKYPINTAQAQAS